MTEDWNNIPAHEWTVTPPLDVFLPMYEKNDKIWWAIGSGHHQNLFDAAIAQCVEKDAELTEATDACNGLHDMVKDLEKENVRLSAIAAKVQDVETFIRKEMLYDHPGDAATVAKKLREYAMLQEENKVYEAKLARILHLSEGRVFPKELKEGDREWSLAFDAVGRLRLALMEKEKPCPHEAEAKRLREAFNAATDVIAARGDVLKANELRRASKRWRPPCRYIF